MKLAAAIVPLIVSVLMWGCGGDDDPGPIPSDLSKGTALCASAMLGKGSSGWRRWATAAGPVGFFGLGRNFLKASPASASAKRQWEGASLETKTPVVLEGDDPVTLSVAPKDRSRARLVAPTDRQFVAYVEIRFVPCPDRPRTSWAAGFLLRDRRPVAVIVQQAGKPAAMLRVGRIRET